MFDDKTISLALKFFNQTSDYHFWKDKNHIYRLMNDTMAKDFGHQSHQVSFKGISDYDHQCKVVELANDFIIKDNISMSNSEQVSLLEIFYTLKGDLKIFYVKKTPILDTNNIVIGVSGIAIDATKCPIICSALLLIPDHRTLINLRHDKTKQVSYQIKNNYENYGLSTRETEVLYYMIRGKVAKEIAEYLGIRTKTVQKYQADLKLKMDCNSRSEVIDKAISNGASLIIPTSILNINRIDALPRMS